MTPGLTPPSRRGLLSVLVISAVAGAAMCTSFYVENPWGSSLLALAWLVLTAAFGALVGRWWAVCLVPVPTLVQVPQGTGSASLTDAYGFLADGIARAAGVLGLMAILLGMTGRALIHRRGGCAAAI